MDTTGVIRGVIARPSADIGPEKIEIKLVRRRRRHRNNNNRCSRRRRLGARACGPSTSFFGR